MSEPTTLKHAKVKTRMPQQDGSTVIETASYYEELNTFEQQIEQKVRTSKATFIADLMKAVAPISDGISRSVKIEIDADDKGQPYRITKTWTVKKEHYGNR
jgi:hypothetical protein